MMNKKRKLQLFWQLPFLLFLIVGTVLIIIQQRDMPYQKDEGFVFGTSYHISYQHEDNLKPAIEKALAEVDSEFSMFNPRSTVARFNRGEKPEFGPRWQEMLALSQRVNKQTFGAFDITVAPLVNAWGFGFKHEALPTKQAVDSLLKIRNSYDFSAVAKGYGCDVVARLLKDRGVSNYMVEIGGEVVARGVSQRRVPWRIGVSKPTDDSLAVGQGELQTVLNITHRAMATSGNYRNFYYKNGRKYAHTIDPRTGYPVQHNILSATVITDTCAVADAYATAFMVLGLDGAQKVLDRHPELMAYLIYTDEKGALAVWYSPALKSKIIE